MRKASLVSKVSRHFRVSNVVGMITSLGAGNRMRSEIHGASRHESHMNGTSPPSSALSIVNGARICPLLGCHLGETLDASFNHLRSLHQVCG